MCYTPWSVFPDGAVKDAVPESPVGTLECKHSFVQAHSLKTSHALLNSCTPHSILVITYEKVSTKPRAAAPHALLSTWRVLAPGMFETTSQANDYPSTTSDSTISSLLTLFSKFFSSFLRSTCSLSVSHKYLALEEVYLPFRAALPNNPTLRMHSYGQPRLLTGLSPS